MSGRAGGSEGEKTLLDRTTTWRKVMAKTTDVEGGSVCDWTNRQNDGVIKKYLKVRRKLLSPDELACQYFWRGHNAFYNKWMASSDVQNLLSFLRLSTSVVDIKETELFFPNGGPDAADFSQLEIVAAIQNEVHNSATFMNAKTSLSCVRKPSFQTIADKMFSLVRDWLSYLGHILKRSPTTTPKCVFEELARSFFTLCGLVCANGKTEQLTLPGEDKECHPDLIFASQHSTSPYWAVVEVKRMSDDPTFKHFFNEPRKGIMKNKVEDPNEAESPSVAEDECIPFKKQRVTYHEKDNNLEKDDEDYDADSGDSALPAYVRDTADIFFSQLFGQIISLDCHQPSRKYRRMGIGVVGFRIFFVAFYAKPGIPFSKIPETKGAKTEVHIAGPLCILSAEDREDIARILLQLAEGRPFVEG